MVGLAPQRERYPEIDRLKAAAILGVIWIHCFNEWGVPRSDFARLSFQITSAAVPAFFARRACSAARDALPRPARGAGARGCALTWSGLGGLVFFAVRGNRSAGRRCFGRVSAT